MPAQAMHAPAPALAGQLVARRQLRGATILTLHRPAPPATTTRRVPFGRGILDALAADGLLGHVLWSTDCTADDVEPGAFRQLAEAGLFLVHLDLGAEQRSRQGACTAVQVLRQLGILVEYEFDLAGPVQRFDTLQANLAFLAAVVCDGSVPLSFRWPVPEDGTCSPWLAAYRDRLAAVIGPWLGVDGLSARLGEAWADLVVAERMLRGLTGIAAHRIALQRLTMRCNSELVALVSRSAKDFELYGGTELLSAANVEARCAGHGRTLDRLRAALSPTPEPPGFLDANTDAPIRPWRHDAGRYDPGHDRRPLADAG